MPPARYSNLARMQGFSDSEESLDNMGLFANTVNRFGFQAHSDTRVEMVLDKMCYELSVAKKGDEFDYLETDVRVTTLPETDDSKYDVYIMCYPIKLAVKYMIEQLLGNENCTITNMYIHGPHNFDDLGDLRKIVATNLYLEEPIVDMKWIEKLTSAHDIHIKTLDPVCYPMFKLPVFSNSLSISIQPEAFHCFLYVRTKRIALKGDPSAELMRQFCQKWQEEKEERRRDVFLFNSPKFKEDRKIWDEEFMKIEGTIIRETKICVTVIMPLDKTYQLRADLTPWTSCVKVERIPYVPDYSWLWHFLHVPATIAVAVVGRLIHEITKTGSLEICTQLDENFQ